MEHLTTGNIALLFVVVYSLLKLVAPVTRTTKDDKVLAAIESARGWVQENAPDFWAIVEAHAQTGSLSGAANKLQAFLNALNAAYHQDKGVDLPQGAVDFAARKAAALSALDKISRPPAGPVSQ
jgi:type II secretory pathway component PulM